MNTELDPCNLAEDGLFIFGLVLLAQKDTHKINKQDIKIELWLKYTVSKGASLLL